MFSSSVFSSFCVTCRVSKCLRQILISIATRINCYQMYFTSYITIKHNYSILLKKRQNLKRLERTQVVNFKQNVSRTQKSETNLKIAIITKIETENAFLRKNETVFLKKIKIKSERFKMLLKIVDDHMLVCNIVFS